MQLPPDFDQLRVLAEAETGMNFSGDRAVRLRDAVAKVNMRQLLGNNPQLGMLERLTAELTIGETFFFRNEHHFLALRERVLPMILQENADKKQVRVWSAGCATGEEPYSVAIVLHELLAGAPLWQLAILGTDINHAFLERARQGLYRDWSFRQTDVHRDRRYFSPEAEFYRLNPAIRERVHFAYLNLVKDVYPSPLTGTLGLDLILFRNVAIYLKPEVTRGIIERFYHSLRPGGWLLLGETELNMVPADLFNSEHIGQATFYRKKGGRHLDVPVPLPKPVLSAMPTQVAPTVPIWTPLPAARKRAAPVSSPWERIQSCLTQCEFTAAERIVAEVEPARERAALRLRYVQGLLACAEQARARQALEACLREDPLLLEAHLLKASFAVEADDLVGAEQACRQALYIDRKCAMAHLHLATLQQQRGQKEAAARSLKTTMKLIDPMDPLALVPHGEGICYGRLQEMVSLLSNP